MPKSYFLLLIIITVCHPVFAQHTPISAKKFFLDDSVINVAFSTDIRALRNDKEKPKWQPAHIVMHFSDTLVIDEDIRVKNRGFYRRKYCEMASLMLDFKTKNSPELSKLEKLKLVSGCHINYLSDELVLKEYLVYKMYNILSPMSFRVRLLHITYNDTQQKVKPYTQYAFLIEDINSLAKRNDCKVLENPAYKTEETNRDQITFVSMFQYMVGNTDWAVPNNHNIKLMVPLADTLARPYTVPYDFDYSGVVDASYAIPSEELGISSVRERYYQGYERTIDELKPIVLVYNEKHDSIMQCINNFDLLSNSDRKNIANYIEQFYAVLKNESAIKYAFITKSLSHL